MILFILRLWDLQVIKGKEYRELSATNRLRVLMVPAPRGIILDRNGHPLVKNIPTFDISAVTEDLPEGGLPVDELGALLGLDSADVRSRLERDPPNPFVPVKLKQSVSFDEVAKVEARKTDYPGLLVEVVVSREYIYDDFASHIIGYLGHLTLQQAKDPDYEDVPRHAFIGQMGVEEIYDKPLRGIAGKQFIEVDATGRVVRLTETQQPVKGKDIRLTLDVNLQTAAEDALTGKRGAVVVLNVNSGEILALTSKPSFNPNLFSRGIHYRDWKKLINDRMKPFINRAVQSQYPPASTFKLVSALAAVEEGIVNWDTRFQCNGSISLDRVFKCWKRRGHGNIHLHTAIVESCDVYFYEIAKKMDIDILSRFASGFGFGKMTGVELHGERSGLVPSRKWKREVKNDRWYTGESLNTIIGQGYLSATPLQMARFMSAIVNGGKLYKPFLVIDEESRTEADTAIKISPANIRLLKSAMRSVVSGSNGTGKRALSDLVSIGGKTGTTQVVAGTATKKKIKEEHMDHAWFIAYAPEDEPEIALSVFVEHGGKGGEVAAPLAKKIIEAYFKNRDGKG